MSKKEPQPKDWREGRRLRGWQLYQQGWKQKDIAQALGVTEGAVSQWIKKARTRGIHALRHQPSPGRPPKLSKEKRAELPAQLSQGAESFGFRGQVWTSKRVAYVIKKVFGMSYDPGHCRRLLQALKYSQQKPIERATQRNEGAIRTWKEQRFDELKRRAKEEGRTIVFLDESAFYLLPLVGRTYAPRGKTPILSVKLSYDHLSAMGGITLDGRLFMQSQDHSYKGPDVVRFLQMLLRKIPGKLLIIWDGASIHRCKVLKAFLCQGGAQRIRLEQLPGYAPELNPQEGVWNLLKRRELKNLCCQDLQQVERELRLALERLRHRKKVLVQCFAHAGYSV